MTTRMTPETRLDIEVQVLHDDDSWYPGTLEHWRRDGDRWQGYVRCNVAPGMNHIAWVDQDEVRQVYPVTIK